MENKPSALPTDSQFKVPPRSNSAKPKWQRFLVWAITLAVLTLILILILHHRDDAKAAAPSGRRGVTGPVTTTVATAQKGNIGVYLEAIGTVTPVYTASITSEVMGLVTQVHYREGQLVHKGEPLIDIDPRPFEAQLLQAQGAFERDTNVLAEAKMDLQRYQQAWAKNSIPKQTLDDQEKLVLQDLGTVKNDEGTVQYDQLQVEYCHITAPFTGQIGLRLIDPGNIVQAAGTTTLAVLAQLQPITVIFTLPEDSLSPVIARLRDHAQLAVDVFDRSAQKKIASGELLALDNQIDTTTGTVKVRAQFDNKDNALFPNQFVTARLLVNTLKGVTLLPASTVQQNGQSSFIYVIENNVAHARTIKPGITDAGMTQVDGVKPGEVVADSSFDKLQDNARVTIVSKPAPAAQPAASTGSSGGGGSGSNSSSSGRNSAP